MPEHFYKVAHAVLRTLEENVERGKDGYVVGYIIEEDGKEDYELHEYKNSISIGIMFERGFGQHVKAIAGFGVVKGNFGMTFESWDPKYANIRKEMINLDDYCPRCGSVINRIQRMIKTKNGSLGPRSVVIATRY